MATYHISLSGEPALCKARTRPCPRQEHYDSLEKAQHVAEMAHEAYGEALEYPRSGFSFVKAQAELFWETDQGFGSGASPYLAQGYTREQSDAERKHDYTIGFDYGLTRYGGEKKALEQYHADRTTGKIEPTVDDTAFKLGFARAQRTIKADRDEFITENVVDRGLRGGEARRKYSTARFLQQPFKRGQTIVVPAGTKFHSWDAESNDVYGEFKEAREIQISDTFQPYIDGSGDWVQLHPAQVSYAGPHGYWRDIVLTPEIIAMNGKPVYEAGMPYESLIRRPLYEDITA